MRKRTKGESGEGLIVPIEAKENAGTNGPVKLLACYCLISTASLIANRVMKDAV